MTKPQSFILIGLGDLVMRFKKETLFTFIKIRKQSKIKYVPDSLSMEAQVDIQTNLLKFSAMKDSTQSCLILGNKLS